MNCLIFQQVTSRLLGLSAGRKSPWGHICGGPPRHRGVRRAPVKRPARLHFCLNLKDPELGIESSPFQWLPLYWSPDYERGFAYRIVNDKQIQILSDPAADAGTNDFTLECIERPAVVSDLRYPKDTEEAYILSGVLGLDGLPARMKATVRKRVLKEYRANWTGEPESDDELLYCAGGSPFCQGVPREPCPNPKCQHHTFKKYEAKVWRGISVMLFSLYATPDDGALYEELAGPDEGHLTFQVCRECFSVHAHNPCT